ncbi:MAG: IS21 family transposase [Gemmatimonadaceae bacterium]
MAKLERTHVMIAHEMVDRAVSVRQVAAQLGVDESTLRYRLGRSVDAPDGRAVRATALAGWDERVDAVLARFGDARVVPDGTEQCEAQLLHDILVREFQFRGSYQAVRRYLKRRFAAAPLQAVRRVETPAGVQAQHDWFDFEAVIGGERRALHGLIGTLSHSRATFVWVSPTMTQLAWQTGHLALFTRYGGVPLWVRIDNLKTGVASGAGPTAVITPAFQTFARTCGFSVDPCRARTGSDKGKVERGVRTDRGAFADLFHVDWRSIDCFQEALDGRATERHDRRRSPMTGTTITEALLAERRLLQPVPTVHEPFDCVVARRVSRHCLVSFEGRRYSVPFASVGRTVEVRGTAQHVVVLADGRELARHARHTAARLLLVPAHYDGESTRGVRAPTPLGRRAQLQLAGVPGFPSPTTIARPLSAYIALVEEACR